MRKATLLVMALVALLALAGPAFAQKEFGEIHGTVMDPSQRSVPKAHVTLSNPDTGYKREIDADENGGYSFAQVPPGTYTITAESPNFSPITLKGVVVNIGASLSLDVSLPVKGAAQTVQVTAVAAPVDTTTAGVSQLINQRNVENLPLNGRDYRDLANLSSSAQVTPGLRGAIRLGGQQGDYSQLVIDGGDSYNNFFGEFFGSLETHNFTVPLESVQEFQVVANGFAPEFGRATGGLINVVTKSGTNEVHGEAHYYAQGANMIATDAVGNPPNIDQRHQFGGSVGFPIHKNSQFLYLATDIQRQHGPLFSSFCGGDPTCTGAPGPTFFTGKVPSNNILPAPCKTASGSVLKSCYGKSALGGFEGSNNQFQDYATVLGHYDWQLSPANHFSIRGYGTRNHTSGFTGGRGENEIPFSFDNSENFINQGLNGVFALNSVLGRKVNEIRVMVSGETRKRHPNAPGLPEVFIASLGGELFGQRYFLPINNDQGKLQAQDNFELSWGHHDIKFGGDVDAFADRKDSFIGWSAGEYEYANVAAFNANQPFGFIQGFGLNGQPIFKAGTLFPSYQTGIGMYWQDKWQVTPKLTLTYGVRWDGTLNPQPQTPLTGNEVYTGIGGGLKIHPVPQRVPYDMRQWGPRVGVAYNLTGGDHPTVIRGAWGLYYAQTPPIFFQTAGGGRTFDEFCFGDPTCMPQAGFPYIFPSNQPPPGSTPGSTAYVDPSFKNPRVSNITASVEHTFFRDFTVSGSFTYAHSSHLKTGSGSITEEVWARNFTSDGTDSFGRAILTGLLDPTLPSSLSTLASFGRGNYEAFTVNATKRFSNHFQMFANYQWSRNKDNASSERDTDTYFGPQDPFNLNLDYGRNGLDVTHQFKATGVYELPKGFTASGILIAHSGVPFPVYVNVDINGDGLSNTPGFNNDRPGVDLGHGKPFLLPRYPFNQPDFFNWDARLSKDFAYRERYHIQLIADFLNLINRRNLYSNPFNSAVNTIDISSLCTPRKAPEMGFNCGNLTAIPRPLPVGENSAGLRSTGKPKFGGGGVIAPDSYPFTFQAGVKFIF